MSGYPIRRTPTPLIPAALLLGAVLSACAGSAMSDDGDIMTGANGMTVYTFDQDRAGSGKSACTGGCAELWPPVPATDVSGDEVGAIMRDDGTRQATYEGLPLYYYRADKMRGDMKGDGFKGVWHAVGEEEYGEDEEDEDYGGGSYY